MADFVFSSELLKDLLVPLAIMADDANIFFDPDRGIRLKLVCFVGYVDGAVFFRKECFRAFQCPKRTSACIELRELVKTLELIDTNDQIVFQFHPEELVLRLRTMITGPLTPERVLLRCFEVPLMEERSEFMKIDESKFVYDLSIGIPAVEFRDILKDLEHHSQFVTFYMKARQLWFKVKGTFHILDEELGHFVTVGPTFTEPVELEFSLHRLYSFMMSSELSRMVWLCWSLDAPAMLNFPVGSFGNIHIYSRLTPGKKQKVADLLVQEKQPQLSHK